MEKMHEISFELIDDGSIRLEQQSGADEPNVIWLHPEQLKHITRRFCGMGAAKAATVEDLERKLSILAGDIDFIVKDEGIRRDIIDNGSGNEFELIARLDALWDLAIEFDGGRLLPREERKPQESAAANSSGKPQASHSANINDATKNESAKQLGLDV